MSNGHIPNVLGLVLVVLAQVALVRVKLVKPVGEPLHRGRVVTVMVLTHRGGVVAEVAHDGREFEPALRPLGRSHLVRIAAHAMVPRAPARQQRLARRRADRCRGVRLREAHTVRGDLVEVGGVRHLVAVDAERVGAGLVDHQQEHVGRVRAGRREVGVVFVLCCGEVRSRRGGVVVTMVSVNAAGRWWWRRQWWRRRRWRRQL